MLTIDGARGEGGGQVLRTSLALALVGGTPVRLENIRARRPRPGLRRQHLTALEAAAAVGGAEVRGGGLGGKWVEFRPTGVRPGAYRFDIGTAGSTTLVLQTILPALLTADAPSTVELEGGTHNPMSPPFEVLDQAFLGVVRALGPAVDLELERAGFFPRGGGLVRARVQPAPLRPLALEERGKVRRRTARAIVAGLPRHIAERELAVLKKRLPWDVCLVEEWPDGPGNVVVCTLECEHLTEAFCAFGRPGLPAEKVAAAAARAVKDYLRGGAPVGPHLQDQLMVPLALAGGSFVTGPLTGHGRTNLDVVSLFRPLVAAPCGAGLWRVSRAPA